MTARHYVYVHRQADDNSIFYVGKGQHRRAYVNGKRRSTFWNAVAKKHGYKVEVVAWFASEEDAFDYERHLISQLRGEGVRLVNLTSGAKSCMLTWLKTVCNKRCLCNASSL